MFILFSGRHVGGARNRAPPTRRLDTVNLRKTFRRISEAWENAETQNLKNRLLNLSPRISQFIDFIHRIIFDLFFRCVTVKTVY